MFNAVLNEPYFSTVKALEDVEVLELNINEIEKIDNLNLINKIYDYIIINIERWLNRYYYLLHKENKIYNNKNNLLEMLKIYFKSGYEDAVYKTYKKYIELYPEKNTDNEEINDLLKKIKPAEEPEKIDKNIYKYKKGFCLYTELQGTDNLYMIKHGQVGIYNIFDSKLVTRRILSTNDIVNGYKPITKSKSLSTTAIVLQDSIIELIKKEDAMNLVQYDKTLRLYYVKIMSMLYIQLYQE